MNKFLAFILSFFASTVFIFAQTTVEYNLISVGNPVGKSLNYVYPNIDYQYKITTIPAPSGFGKGEFNIELKNGIFSDYNKPKINNINEGVTLNVKWADVGGVRDSAIINITNAKSTNEYHYKLKKLNDVLKYRIASLKGINPSVSIIGENAYIPSFGNKGVLVTSGSVMEYPEGINDTLPGRYIQRKRVKTFEWTLPKGWKISGSSAIADGIYRTNTLNDVRIITDYFSLGDVTVKGVNDIGSAFSEVYKYATNRKLPIINAPGKIEFGKVQSYTYEVASLPGATYNWETPSGWKINNDGNTVSGSNLNKITVVPSFCSLTNDTVRLSLQKDGEISEWFILPGRFSGSPSIRITSPEPIYQYESAALTLGIPDNSSIQQAVWSGDGIQIVSGQGTQNPTIYFTKTGDVNINVSLQMKGCSNIFSLTKKIKILPHRFSISGNVQVCEGATYAINNISNIASGATVQWSVSDSNIASINSNGELKRIQEGKVLIQATILLNNFPITLSPYSVTILNEFSLQQPLGITKGGPECLDGMRTQSFCANYKGNYNLASLGLTEVEWEINYEGSHKVRYNDSNTPYCGDIISEIPKSRMAVDFGSAVPPQMLVLRVRAKSKCGNWTKWSPGYYFNIHDCSQIYSTEFKVSLNSAKDMVTLNIENDKDENAVSATQRSSLNIKTLPYEVQIWNEAGIGKKLPADQSIVEIPVGDLPKGTYFIQVIKDGKTYRQQLIIK